MSADMNIDHGDNSCGGEGSLAMIALEAAAGAGAGDVALKPGAVVDDISDVDGPEGDRGAVMAGVVCGCPCA